MATDTNLLDDDRIGGYRFVRMVHAGQNTTVMEVLQESTGRRFVMKQLLASRTGSASERKAFDHEARLGLTLRHPNLIQVYDYVKAKDQPYFVMDYFPSVHLGLVVAKPDKYGLAPGIMHSVIRQSAAGLAYLHDRNWVHRDIKPANIIVSKGGDARLIDYALAMRPFSVVPQAAEDQAPAAGDVQLHVAGADPLRPAGVPRPTFTASASPAMNWPADASPSARTPPPSC